LRIDKFGGLAVSEGLHTPRKPRSLPTVLSEAEVRRVLSAAPSLRDKALLSILYACGLRLSEVCRLKWSDIDLWRGTVRVWRGKGMKDRNVMTPASMEGLFRRGKERARPDDFVFPGERRGRYISPRTAEHIMSRAVRIAGIGKPATCKSLRHSFATHLIEHGTDTRFVQELLGHARLETTRIYTHVAAPRLNKVVSPLDRLYLERGAPGGPLPAGRPPSGQMRISLGDLRDFHGIPGCEVTIVLRTQRAMVNLPGSRVVEPRAGWVTLEVPPLEDWNSELQKLSPQDRLKVESANFYEELRVRVTRRFLALRSQRGAG